MITDPIADLLTRIRNAGAAKKALVHVPYSGVKENICRVLKENEYIANVKTVGEGVAKELLVELLENKRDICLTRVSKPGQRIYVKRDGIKKVLNGLGISIISTPKGIMSGSEARKANLGGELLCEVY